MILLREDLIEINMVKISFEKEFSMKLLDHLTLRDFLKKIYSFFIFSNFYEFFGNYFKLFKNKK